VNLKHVVANKGRQTDGSVGRPLILKPDMNHYSPSTSIRWPATAFVCLILSLYEER
jgi:hypothetical protein